ncbi:MAG: nucleotidyltransferase family protein [Bacteroidetes bacterium]|nr:nucleotidyltransferase family protein [Bacteroidota bacterium]
MNLEEIKIILKKQKKSLQRRFKIKEIALFGSYTRGEQNDNSDVDIMVEFESPIGIEFIDLADELEKVLNTKVDLVSRNAMKPRLMKYIEKELIYV